MFPSQNIPENKKDKDWGQSCVKSIVEMAYTNPYSKDKDRMCYNLFNGIIDEKFDYLTKVGDMAFPARLRFIPLIRPRVERLQMEEATKPFVFRAQTVDADSLTQKKDAAIQQILSVSRILYSQKIAQSQAMVAQLQMAGQQAQQQGQPPNPMLQMQLEAIQFQTQITKDDMDKASAALKVRPQDLKEIIMQKGLKRYMQDKGLDELFNTAFLDLCITDKEYYMVDYPGNGRDPVVKLIRVDDFWHSADSGTDFVDECEMACYRERMSPARVLDEFGDDLKENGGYEEIERYRNNWTLSRDIFPNERMFVNSEMDSCNNGAGLYGGSEIVTNTIDVWRTEWRSIRQVKIKQSVNPYNDNLPFNHIVKNGEETKLREGDSLQKRYVTDVWRGNLIGNTLYAGIKKRPWQLRNPNEPSFTPLSYTGPSFGRRQRRPNSIVWVTKDIQILYCLLYYHHELWLALSGVRGIVMDKSQKPAGMSDKEWQYARKTGTMWVQTTAGGKQISTFNQFQNFDDSLPSTINYLREMMMQLEDIVSSITGVNRQRMGQSEQHDLKSVTNESIYQSTLVTGMMFYRHDRIKKRVMTMLSNTCAMAWNEGKTIINAENPDDIIDIPPGLLSGTFYNILTEDSMKQDKIMGDIRVLAGQDHMKGQLSLSDVVKLYNVDSVKELEVTLDKMNTISQERAQGNADAQMKHEEDLKNMDAQIKAEAVKQQGMLGQMKLQLDAAKLQWEQSKGEQELEQDHVHHSEDDDTKRFDIESNRATELDYLKQDALQSAAELALEQQKMILDSKKPKTPSVSKGGQAKNKTAGQKGKK